MDFSQIQKNRVNTLLIQMVECYRDERKLSDCVSLLDELSLRYSINDIVAQANPELLNFFSDRIWPFILWSPSLKDNHVEFLLQIEGIKYKFLKDPKVAFVSLRHNEYLHTHIQKNILSILFKTLFTSNIFNTEDNFCFKLVNLNLFNLLKSWLEKIFDWKFEDDQDFYLCSKYLFSLPFVYNYMELKRSREEPSTWIPSKLRLVEKRDKNKIEEVNMLDADVIMSDAKP